MEAAFSNTDLILHEMTDQNWIIDYGENLKESIVYNLRYFYI